MLGRHDGELSMMYWPHWAIAAAQVRGVAFTTEEQAALDAVNALTRREDLVLNTNFQPGDIQYLNNYKILHSRTDYEDFEAPEKKRYLERLWICTDPEPSDSCPGFADLHGPRSIIDGVASCPRPRAESTRALRRRLGVGSTDGCESQPPQQEALPGSEPRWLEAQARAP